MVYGSTYEHNNIYIVFVRYEYELVSVLSHWKSPQKKRLSVNYPISYFTSMHNLLLYSSSTVSVIYIELKAAYS